MAKIAIFLPRSPCPPMNGRKAGIHAALAALANENHEIDLFVFANPEGVAHSAKQSAGEAVAAARRTHWLGAPSRPILLRNASLSVLGRSEYSLNEALFRSKKLLAYARQLCRAYDFAIADTIRVAPYASELGVPWHLDLDDLYSTRYEKYLEKPEELSGDLLLGYYRNRLPRAVRTLPKTVVRWVLEREAKRLKSREVYWARRATTVSLASPVEAEAFSRTAGRPVYSSLMSSVRIPASRWMPDNVNGAGAVFLGGLDYKPNLDALLYYQEAVFPLLRAARGVSATLNHIGNAPADLRKKFLPGVVNFEGYIADAVQRLTVAPLFLAPIVSGTGIKTKVLEAMAIGLPVVATSQAVAGLQVEHGNHCFICERPGDFVEGVRHLGNPHVAEKMGLAARKFVERNFSSEVLRQRWARVIAQLGDKPCVEVA